MEMFFIKKEIMVKKLTEDMTGYWYESLFIIY